MINQCAPLAQLDRASDYGSEGWGFESLRAHHPQIGPSPRTGAVLVVGGARLGSPCAPRAPERPTIDQRHQMDLCVEGASL